MGTRVALTFANNSVLIPAQLMYEVVQLARERLNATGT
jgi:hypothetical protein